MHFSYFHPAFLPVSPHLPVFARIAPRGGILDVVESGWKFLILECPLMVGYRGRENWCLSEVDIRRPRERGRKVLKWRWVEGPQGGTGTRWYRIKKGLTLSILQRWIISLRWRKILSRKRRWFFAGLTIFGCIFEENCSHIAVPSPLIFLANLLKDSAATAVCWLLKKRRFFLQIVNIHVLVETCNLYKMQQFSVM